MTLPKKMKALKVLGPNCAEIQDVSVPEPQSHEILVQVSHVALNPVDWHSRLIILPSPSPSKKAFAVGERVFGWVGGNNVVRRDNGAFAEYVVVDAELCVRVPERLEDEEAVTVGAGIATAGMGVFMKHGIPLPGEDGWIESAAASAGETMLIYSGTSATGGLAIQMARLAGLNPIATCSAVAIPSVTALGATAAFEYHSPGCGEAINSHTSNSLTKTFDTIATPSSLRICLAALSTARSTRKKRKISTTLHWPADLPKPEDVETSMLFTLGIFGVDTGYGESVVPANADDYAYAKRLYAVAERWLQEGTLKPHPPKVCGEAPGLERVFEAMEVARGGGGSGVKLVVRL